MKSILDLLVPQRVHHRVQQGGDDHVGHRDQLILIPAVLGLGLEVGNGGTAVVDYDHREVGGAGGEGLLPALGRGDLEDGGDDEDVGNEDQPHGHQNNK